MKTTTTFLLAVLMSGSVIGQFANWTKLNYDYLQGASYSPYTKMSVAVTGDDKIYAYTKDVLMPIELSVDNGNSWNPISANNYNLAVFSDDQGGVFRVKYRNKFYPDSVFHSPDNGVTWNFVSVSTNHPNNLSSYYDIKGAQHLHRKDNMGTLYIGEGSKGEDFKYSKDNGASWTTVVTPVQPFSALVASDGTIYFSTYNSGIYVSTDGGTTWDNSGYSSTTTAFELNEHPTTGEVYMVMGGMGIKKTADKGQSWPTVAPKPNLAPIKKMYISPDGMFYLQTSKEIFESADGITYNEILTYSSQVDFVKDMAVSDDYVYAQVDSSLYRYQRQKGGGTASMNENGLAVHSLYPVPNKGVFTLIVSGNAEVEISNINGQSIYRKTLDGNSTVDISKQPVGIYMLKVIYDNGQTAQQLFSME